VGCRKLPVQDYFQFIENSHTKYRRARFISVTQKASGKITRTTRQGAYFTAPVMVSNTSNSVTEELDITAVKFDIAQDKDIVNTITGKYTVAKTPQTFTYDDDGNLLSDGKFTYTWNAENRLIEIHNSSFLIRNSYDYMGRRISKKVYTHNGTDWVLEKDQKFVYNGYKQIASFDSMGNAYMLARTYIWQPTGQDIPLWTKNHTTSATDYYIADGNKNIRSMVDINGNEVATYDYTPFGSVRTSSGTYANTNPFRFSSEYHDNETGLVYYNFRYYNPDIGRWTKRDPIGEKGGYNLYGMVGNSPVDRWDFRGQKIKCCKGKPYDDSKECCCNKRKIILRDNIYRSLERLQTVANVEFKSPKTKNNYGLPYYGIKYILWKNQCGEQADRLRNVLLSAGENDYWEITLAERKRSIWQAMRHGQIWVRHNVVIVIAKCKKGDCPYTGERIVFDAFFKDYGYGERSYKEFSKEYSNTIKSYWDYFF
jgi:RHS repeat-associated protein